MSVINITTFKQVAALELKNLEVKYGTNTNFIEVSNNNYNTSGLNYFNKLTK